MGVLLVVVAVAAIICAVLSTYAALRLKTRVSTLEQNMADSPQDDESGQDVSVPEASHMGEYDSEYVITTVGAAEEQQADTPFAQLVLRESVVMAASWAEGVRRALSPETRNRIRFQMKQQVKQARKARKAEIKQLRKELRTRKRAELAEDHTDPRRAEVRL